MQFLCLLIYGINGDNREWMPRPEFNVYSFSYWFLLASSFFLLIASKQHVRLYKINCFKIRLNSYFSNLAVLLLLESKDLYAIYRKNQAIKRQYEAALPLNSTLHLNLNASMSNSQSVQYA